MKVNFFLRKKCLNGMFLGLTLMLFSFAGFAQYCVPTSTNGCSLYNIDINSFSLSGENGTAISDLNTGCQGNGYIDQTSQEVSLAPGTSYVATVTTSGFDNGEVCAIWIDFNDDETFDFSERVNPLGPPPEIGPDPTSVSIEIPSSAVLGLHRMRVVGEYGITYPNPCNDNPLNAWESGEVQDYTVNIIVPGSVIAQDSINVTTLNNVAAEITTNNGTLQMVATIYPSNSDQAVTWSIIPGTGTATIDLSGLVTAQTEGMVWAKAVSVQDITLSDSLLITISYSIPPQGIDSIVVKTQGNVNPVINTLAGTLQMQALIYPASINQAVIWSILPATGIATVSTSGLVTAQQNGSIWVKAVSVEDISQSDSLQVTVTGQGETAINEIGTLKGFAIYPNPAGQEVNIALKGSHTSLDILLTDVYGRKINQQHVAANSQGSITKITLDKIVPGLYFIRVKGPGIQLIDRVVFR